jgi:hypothetical protein
MAFTIGILATLMSVLLATPLCILPAKDSFEQLFFPKGMDNLTNLAVTLVMILICAILAVLIENIGDAITILGSLTNPSIGFILPGLFYLNLVKNES